MPTFGIVVRLIYKDGCHHWLNGHEFGQALGDGEGQEPGLLHSLGSQRVGHNWMTEKQKVYLDTNNILLFVWLYILRGVSPYINQ